MLSDYSGYISNFQCIYFSRKCPKILMRDLDCKYKKLTIMGSIGLALQLQQEKRSLSLHEKAKMRVSYNTVIKEKKNLFQYSNKISVYNLFGRFKNSILAVLFLQLPSILLEIGFHITVLEFSNLFLEGSSQVPTAQPHWHFIAGDHR